MILEAARLSVRPGQGRAFEAAFARAQGIIAAAHGYLGHELQRCLEIEDTYLLLVRWRSVEDHAIGFRGSPPYQEWKRLLHHFYEPFPVVEHFELVEPRPQGRADG
jgi:heme-degrading monooxygenase HmoA